MSVPSPMSMSVPSPTRIARSLLLLTALALFTAACGADIGDEPTTGGTEGGSDENRVANARFEGEFMVTSVVLAGQEFPLQNVATVTIETIFGTLTVIPGCNTYFGSYTLTESGLASFTVAGGSNQDCGGLRSQEDAVLAALGAAEHWIETADGFLFESDKGDTITIAR